VLRCSWVIRSLFGRFLANYGDGDTATLVSGSNRCFRKLLDGGSRRIAHLYWMLRNTDGNGCTRVCVGSGKVKDRGHTDHDRSPRLDTSQKVSVTGAADMKVNLVGLVNISAEVRAKSKNSG
jgi:hypothetical protein